MSVERPSLIARDDTMLGVCAGLGEDLGFNPLLLRIVFAVLLLWNPVVVLSVYAALGVIVFAGRKLFPDAQKTTLAADAAPAERKILAHQNDAGQPALAEAA